MVLVVLNGDATTVFLPDSAIDRIKIKGMPPCTPHPFRDPFVFGMIGIVQDFHLLVKPIRSAAVLHRRVANHFGTMRIRSGTVGNETLRLYRMYPTVTEILFIVDLLLRFENFTNGNRRAVNAFKLFVKHKPIFVFHKFGLYDFHRTLILISGQNELM